MKTAMFCVDGFTFRRINDYYRDEHLRRGRLQPQGLKTWVRHEIARHLGWTVSKDQLSLDCHFYHPYEDPRVRPASAQNVVGSLRFEETLQTAGFVLHYTAEDSVRRLRPNMDLCDDALLAAVYGQVDVLVLLSTQGQYATLPARLRDLGVPTLLIGWEGTCSTRAGDKVPWRTDRLLRRNATAYTGLEMTVGSAQRTDDPLVEQLFVPRGASRQASLALAC